jgi:hypothetical protein
MHLLQRLCGILLFLGKFMRGGRPADALAFKVLAALAYLVLCEEPVMRVPGAPPAAATNVALSGRDSHEEEEEEDGAGGGI